MIGLLFIVAVALAAALFLKAGVYAGDAAGGYKGPLDAELQLYDEETVEATAAGEQIDLGENFSPAPIEPVTVLVVVTARDHTTGNETYVLTLEESSGGAFTATGLSVAITATGQIVKVTGLTKRYVRAVLTLAGTSPSITLSAWLIRA